MTAVPQKWLIGADGKGALVDLTPEEIAQQEIDRAASIAADAEQAKEQTAQNALVAAVRSNAASAEGKSMPALTATEQRSLLAILLWKAGALNKDGTVKPLSEWVK